MPLAVALCWRWPAAASSFFLSVDWVQSRPRTRLTETLAAMDQGPDVAPTLAPWW